MSLSGLSLGVELVGFGRDSERSEAQMKRSDCFRRLVFKAHVSPNSKPESKKEEEEG